MASSGLVGSTPTALATLNSQNSGLFINELLDTISENPGSTIPRVLLMQQYHSLGWTNDAVGVATELLRNDPTNKDAMKLMADYKKRRNAENALPKARRAESQKKAPSKTSAHEKGVGPPIQAPTADQEFEEMEQQLLEGYPAALKAAQNLLQQVIVLREVTKDASWDERAGDLRALAAGRIGLGESTAPPASVLAASRMIQEAEIEQPGQAVNAAVADMEKVVHWMRYQQEETVDNDTIRTALTRRAVALAAALIPELESIPEKAVQHIEHEMLAKSYANEETMLGDAINSIPRERFFVSEDGYAWDMAELAECLDIGQGVMRNPLSRQMFTPTDIQSIVHHPLGMALAAKQIEQSQLARGVRPATITALARLSAVLLEDQSDDQKASREALDVFLQCLARLPKAEQRAVDVLRVPAHDSHTGHPFDCSIGDIVRDAAANRTCFHKAGDLLGQAARYLRESPHSSTAE